MDSLPAADWRSGGAWTARTSAPVLIGNYFDPATDYAGAVASDQFLKNSRLLSYAGWGHCAFERSDCVRSHVISYLLDGSLPPAGTVCPANPSPFLPAMSPTSTGEGGGLKSRSLTIGLPPLWLER